MKDPLQPMKRFLFRTIVTLFLGTTPFQIWGYMWHDPESRDFLRHHEGQPIFWIAAGGYVAIMVMFWCYWATRSNDNRI